MPLRAPRTRQRGVPLDSSLLSATLRPA